MLKELFDGGGRNFIHPVEKIPKIHLSFEQGKTSWRVEKIRKFLNEPLIIELKRCRSFEQGECHQIRTFDTLFQPGKTSLRVEKIVIFCLSFEQGAHENWQHHSFCLGFA